MKESIKKNVFSILLIFISVVLCVACPSDLSVNTTVNVRISLSSSPNAESEAKVLLEGSDGNLISGSTVSLSNLDGATSLLDFDFSRGGYIGAFSPSTQALYRLRIKTALASSLIVMDIPHVILTQGPSIAILEGENSEGTIYNALSGQRIPLSSKITIGWEAVTNATVYQIQIRKAGTLIYIASATDNYCLVPAGILLDVGMYSVRIIAQYQSGDAYFENLNYWSFSEYAGASKLFEME